MNPARCLLAAMVLAASGEAIAEDWLVVSGRSHHFDRRGQVEANYGAGLERRYSDAWSAGVGAYRNSSGDASLYAVAGYSPFRRGSARLGVVGGLVTGYEPSACVLGGLMASIEGRRVGVNFLFIPSAGGVAFAQIKFRLD